MSSGSTIIIPGLTAANNVNVEATIQSLFDSGMSLCDVRAQFPCLSNNDFYGLNYEGGIIFWVNGCSGYVAAPNDQSSAAPWWDGPPIYVGIEQASFGSESETASIVAALGGPGNYAASICDDLVLNGYSDWFLPGWFSILDMEFNLGLGGSANLSGDYWCSWENNTNAAEARFIVIGGTNGFGNKAGQRKVRAIRQF